jgi:hypothetical protein
MSDHKEMDKKSKSQRGLSRRAQLRQQQKAIDRLNLLVKDCLNTIIVHRNQATGFKKLYEKAIEMTPQEKATLAYQMQLKMTSINEEICKIGACIHKECRKEV